MEKKNTQQKCVSFVLTELRVHSYQLRAALKSKQDIQDMSKQLVGYINWLLFLYFKMAYDA